MERNKVVVKYKDGALIKGQTGDFFPNKTTFHMETLHGELKEIQLAELKAVFFVKDFEGNKDHVKTYHDHVAGGGRKIKVIFQDGEEIIGYTLGYSPERQGFMLLPGDLSGNNERIYVLKSGTKKIEFI
jgi:hypothetical protein